MPRPEQPPCPSCPIAGPGATTSLPLVPMSLVMTPMCTFGNPPGSVASTLMKFGKFARRFACLSAIELESSTTNSRSRS